MYSVLFLFYPRHRRCQHTVATPYLILFIRTKYFLHAQDLRLWESIKGNKADMGVLGWYQGRYGKGHVIIYIYIGQSLDILFKHINSIVHYCNCIFPWKNALIVFRWCLSFIAMELANYIYSLEPKCNFQCTCYLNLN